MVFFRCSLLMISILLYILQAQQVVSVHVKSSIVDEDITETTTDNVVSVEKSTTRSKVNSNSISLNNTVQMQRREFGTSRNIPDNICERLEELFSGNVECNCRSGFTTFTPYFQSKCNRKVRRLLRRSYTVSTTTQLIPLPPYITSKICLENYTIFGIFDWRPICFGFLFDTDDNRKRSIIPNKVRSCNTNKMMDCIVSGRDKKIRKSLNIVKDCTVTIGSGADAITCDSCTPCNKIGGIKFNCTNVGNNNNNNLQTDTCFNLLPYRGPGSIPSLVIPNLILTNGTTIELS